MRRSALLLTSAFLLAGCPRGQDAGDGRIPIRFSGYVSSPAETALMEKLVADFNREQAEIRLTYEPVPGQYFPKLLTMLVSRTAPDVFYLDVLQFRPLLAKKVLRPLTPYVKANPKTKPGDFLPTLWDAFSDGGELWGVPKDFNALAFFYNKARFDEAKIPYPDASWDFAKVRETARALSTDGKHGFSMPADDMARFMPVAWAHGATVFKPDGACGLGEPPAVAALDWYTGMRNADKSAVLPAEIGSSWPGDAFGRGDAAMVFEGGWLVPYLADSFPKLDYGVTTLPKGPAGRHNLLFTVAYVVPEACPHPEAAWKVIEFLTSPASQAQVTFALPSRRAEAAKYVAERPAYQPILDGAAYARPFAFGPRGDKIKDRVGVAMQEVFLGVKPAGQALADAAGDIDMIGRL